jgi:hypothetical protein
MNEVIEAEQRPGKIITVEQPSAAPTPALLLQMAVQQNADLDKLERLMALQERWEATEARKAYDRAFSDFKAEAVRILKNRQVNDGPLRGKAYAELFAVVNAVTPALSKHGLSSSWKITRDEPTWIEVTCTLKHVGGHSESVAMGGPPDAGGAKNAIMARASTVTYLERYTLKAITGLSEQDDDDDGGHREGQGTDDGDDTAEHPKLQAGRDAAMNGMEALTAWWGKLSAQDRKALNGEFPRLRKAAQNADRGG